jgi:hypothetical protein
VHAQVAVQSATARGHASIALSLTTSIRLLRPASCAKTLSLDAKLAQTLPNAWAAIQAITNLVQFASLARKYLHSVHCARMASAETVSKDIISMCRMSVSCAQP